MRLKALAEIYKMHSFAQLCNLCKLRGQRAGGPEDGLGAVRLYRSQILQGNMRWKALAEIYTMHTFAPFSNLIVCQKFNNILANLQN